MIFRVVVGVLTFGLLVFLFGVWLSGRHSQPTNRPGYLGYHTGWAKGTLIAIAVILVFVLGYEAFIVHHVHRHPILVYVQTVFGVPFIALLPLLYYRKTGLRYPTFHRRFGPICLFCGFMTSVIGIVLLF